MDRPGDRELLGRDISRGRYRGMRRFETPIELEAEYRDLLLKVLFVQGLSELISVLTFRDWLDKAPTIDDRWLLAKIIADEARHGWQVCKILQDFGSEGRRVVEEVMARVPGEHKLEAFNMPLETWGDVLAFLLLIDRVGGFQARNLEGCSYAPLARALPLMIHEEQLHIGAGVNGFRQMINERDYYGDKGEAQRLINKWYPRALDMFGHSQSSTGDLAMELGLKRWTNEEIRRLYIEEAGRSIQELGLDVPPEDYHRRIR